MWYLPNFNGTETLCRALFVFFWLTQLLAKGKVDRRERMKDKIIYKQQQIGKETVKVKGEEEDR
jgi:hypothetical protein